MRTRQLLPALAGALALTAPATVAIAAGGPPNIAAARPQADSLARGTIDGVVFPTTSLIAYDLPGRLKAGTQDVSFGTVVLTYAMSQNARDI